MIAIRWSYSRTSISEIPMAFKIRAACKVFAARAFPPFVVPWVNMSHDSMRDSYAVLILLKHLY
jgi:hypothetical protein